MKNSNVSNAQSSLDKVIDSQIVIPPQPAILLEINKLLNKSGSHLTAIGNLINKDVGLTAAIFKLVNSSFYKSPMTISDIQKAITVLGLTQVESLIKAMSLRKAINGQELAYDKFWSRAEDIATISAIIARKQISVCNIAVDQAYMAGLFHDCGVPILMQRFPEYCRLFRLNKDGVWPDLHAEDKNFNTDHAVVGFMVTKHWALPDYICQAVRFHHDRLSVDYVALTLVSILQMAQHLQTKVHHLVDNKWPLIEDQVLEEIGISKEGSSEFMEDVLEIFAHQ